MLLLRVHSASIEQLLEVASTALAVRNSISSRSANQALFDAIGTALEGTDEAYNREALDYHLGHIFAHLGQAEAAADCFARSGVHPAHSQDLLYPVHVQQSLEVRVRQNQAFERGVPAILIAAMPRSASASLSSTVALTLDSPEMQVSAGRFPSYCIVPRWLNSFSPGGAVTHDHFGASDFNLKAIRDCLIRDVFVQVRDPRAAAASFVLHLDRAMNVRREQEPPSDHEKRIIAMCLEHYYPWLDQWLARTRGPDPGIRIHWILFNDVRASMTRVIDRMFDALGFRFDGTIREARVHMGHADDEAWRARVSRHGQQLLWEKMPRDAVDLLNLRP